MTRATPSQLNIKMSEEENIGQKRFKEGLKKITGDDSLVNYVYAGGNVCGAELAYFHTKNPGVSLPGHKLECVCTHEILKNYYIKHVPTKMIVVVGSCCIKRYLPEDNQRKTCSECGAPHKNRTVDMCNECRPGCWKCGDKYASIDQCWTCRKELKNYHCSRHNYQRQCYRCKEEGKKMCIGCNEERILMPCECKECDYNYWVCPKHTFRTSCKPCYAKSKEDK